MIDSTGAPSSGATVGAAVGGGAAGGTLLIIVVAVLACRSRRSRSGREHATKDSGGGAIEMIPDKADNAYTAGPPALERQYSDPVDVRRPISASLYERQGGADSSRPKF